MHALPYLNLTLQAIPHKNDVFKTVQIHLPLAIHELFLLDSWFAIPPLRNG